MCVNQSWGLREGKELLREYSWPLNEPENEPEQFMNKRSFWKKLKCRVWSSPLVRRNGGNTDLLSVGTWLATKGAHIM